MQRRQAESTSANFFEGTLRQKKIPTKSTVVVRALWRNVVHWRYIFWLRSDKIHPCSPPPAVVWWSKPKEKQTGPLAKFFQRENVLGLNFPLRSRASNYPLKLPKHSRIESKTQHAAGEPDQVSLSPSFCGLIMSIKFSLFVCLFFNKKQLHKLLFFWMESDAFERQSASKNAENCWMKWKGSEVTQLCVDQFSLFSCEFHLFYSIDDRKRKRAVSPHNTFETQRPRGGDTSSTAVAFGLLRIIDEAQNTLGFASQLPRIPHQSSVDNGSPLKVRVKTPTGPAETWNTLTGTQKGSRKMTKGAEKKIKEYKYCTKQLKLKACVSELCSTCDREKVKCWNRKK